MVFEAIPALAKIVGGPSCNRVYTAPSIRDRQMGPVAVVSLPTASFHNSVVGSRMTVAFGGVCIARAVIGFDVPDILDHEMAIEVLGGCRLGTRRSWTNSDLFG